VIHKGATVMFQEMVQQDTTVKKECNKVGGCYKGAARVLQVLTVCVA
jgi:hypothetical protein